MDCLSPFFFSGGVAVICVVVVIAVVVVIVVARRFSVSTLRVLSSIRKTNKKKPREETATRWTAGTLTVCLIGYKISKEGGAEWIS